MHQLLSREKIAERDLVRLGIGDPGNRGRHVWSTSFAARSPSGLRYVRQVLTIATPSVEPLLHVSQNFTAPCRTIGNLRASLTNCPQLPHIPAEPHIILIFIGNKRKNSIYTLFVSLVMIFETTTMTITKKIICNLK